MDTNVNNANATPDVVVARLNALNALLVTAGRVFSAEETREGLDAIFGEGACAVKVELARVVAIGIEALGDGLGQVDVVSLARAAARTEIAKAQREAEEAEEALKAARKRRQGRLKGDLARR